MALQAAINLNQNFYHLPIREVRRGEAKLLISVPILDREVFARVWELRVGRVNVYLLDTDISENIAEDRRITAELYGGDLEMRMRQEIVLGIGGVKASDRARNSAGRFSHERRTFGVSGAGTHPSQCCGEEARFLFGASGRRGGECFYHAHARSRRQRLIFARDDAEIFRRSSQRN